MIWKTISIRNIYWMLVYAFDVLKDDGYKHISDESFENAEDLLAAILAKGVANQLRRGIGKEYTESTQAIRTVKGKIDLPMSIGGRMRSERRLVCTFDEYSEDIQVNRILKTAMKALLASRRPDGRRRRDLNRLLILFRNVEDIDARNIQWNRLVFHRNNATYEMLMFVCRLVLEELIPNEEPGRRKAAAIGDDRMSALFERFVYRYYETHFASESVAVGSPRIKWRLDEDSDALAFLPGMNTDVAIRFGGRVLIIDTKCYSQILQGRHDRGGRARIRSAHLYQMFAYVKNFESSRQGGVSGLLLYAKTDGEDVDAAYLMSGNRIGAAVLDLNVDFEEVKRKLDGILGAWCGELVGMRH